MKAFTCITGALGSLFLLTPAMAFAQNTNAMFAVNLTVGQEAVSVFVATAAPDNFKWYYVSLVAGRSYCAELTTQRFETNRVDPKVQIYSQVGGGAGPLVVENDNSAGEPFPLFNARACFIPASAGVYYVVATASPGSVGFNRNYALRVIETTLWSPWFFIGGDYNAFTLLRNTTAGSCTTTETWRDAAGTVLGQTTSLVPPNGSVAVNARTFVPAPAINGSAEVAHNCSPGAMVGHQTSLSSSTGLNFDSPFESRQPW